MARFLEGFEEYVFDSPFVFFILLLIGLFEVPVLAIGLILIYLLLRMID